MCEYCDGTKRSLVEIDGDTLDNEGNEWIHFDACIEDGFLTCGEYEQDTQCVDRDWTEIRYCPMCGRDLREKENGKPQVAKPTHEGKTVYCVTCDDVLDDYVECTFYRNLEEAKHAAESDAFYGDSTFYIHELKKERVFRTELVTTYDFLEVLP